MDNGILLQMFIPYQNLAYHGNQFPHYSKGISSIAVVKGLTQISSIRFNYFLFDGFLFLHPSILEPDFNLAFTEIETLRQLPPFRFCYVRAANVLLFQLSYLELSVRFPLFPQMQQPSCADVRAGFPGCVDVRCWLGRRCYVV